MQFDIKELYPPTVTDGTLNSNFAESCISISQDNIQFINTDKSLYYFTIISHGLKKNATAPLMSQWASMILPNFVS